MRFGAWLIARRDLGLEKDGAIGHHCADFENCDRFFTVAPHDRPASSTGELIRCGQEKSFPVFSPL
jgi:hypothetical protein